jgi:hypothetical protein
MAEDSVIAYGSALDLHGENSTAFKTDWFISPEKE